MPKHKKKKKRKRRKPTTLTGASPWRVKGLGMLVGFEERRKKKKKER